MATRYNVVPSAVSNWRKAGRFPARLHLRIDRDTKALGIKIDERIFVDGLEDGEAAL